MLGPKSCCCEVCVLPSCSVVALPTSGTCYADWTVETGSAVILEGRVVSNGVTVSDLVGLSGSLSGTVAVTGSGVSVYVRTACGATTDGPVTECPDPPDYCQCYEEILDPQPVLTMPQVTFHVAGNGIGLPFKWGYRPDAGGLPIAAPADIDLTADYSVDCDIHTIVYPVAIPGIIEQYMGPVWTPPGRYTPRFDYDVYYAAFVELRYHHDGVGNYLIKFLLVSGYALRPPGVPPIPGIAYGYPAQSSRQVILRFDNDHPFCPTALELVSDTSYFRTDYSPFGNPLPLIDCYDVSGLTITYSM